MTKNIWEDFIDQPWDTDAEQRLRSMTTRNDVQIFDNDAIATMDLRGDRIRVWLNADRTDRVITEG